MTCLCLMSVADLVDRQEEIPEQKEEKLAVAGQVKQPPLPLTQGLDPPLDAFKISVMQRILTHPVVD